MASAEPSSPSKGPTETHELADVRVQTPTICGWGRLRGKRACVVPFPILTFAPRSLRAPTSFSESEATRRAERALPEASGRTGRSVLRIRGSGSEGGAWELPSGSRNRTLPPREKVEPTRCLVSRLRGDRPCTDDALRAVPLRQTHAPYRTRFGIETSYRLWERRGSHDPPRTGSARALRRGGATTPEPVDDPEAPVCKRRVEGPIGRMVCEVRLRFSTLLERRLGAVIGRLGGIPKVRRQGRLPTG